MTMQAAIDPKTLSAVQQFAQRIRRDFPVKQILLFGSRARGDHQADSDVDVAVVLEGERQPRLDAVKQLSDPAWDVMLDSGLFISPYPLWQDEWDNPALVSNPWFIRNIKAEGIAV
jgi:uncharacterized protein